MNKGHFKKGESHHRWNGGKYITKKVIYVKCPENHPNKNKRGYINEAVLVAEKSLGKYLPIDAVVHHIDGNPHNNIPSNLVVCQNGGYHKYLHERQTALRNCGNVHKRKCKYCGEYDFIEKLKLYTGSNGARVHPKCAAIKSNKYYHTKMGHI